MDEGVLKANQGNFSMTMPSEGFPAVVSDQAELVRVKYSDLDQNRPVNNARDVEWIFNHLDQHVLEEKSPSFFDIEYKHEVKSGDVVALKKAEIEKQPLTYAVEGSLSGTGKVCVKAKIIF